MLILKKIARLIIAVVVLGVNSYTIIPAYALSPKSMIRTEDSGKALSGRSFIDEDTPVPVSKDKPEINVEKLKFWMDREDHSGCKKVKQKIGDILQKGKISFSELNKGLGVVCRELKNHLQPDSPFILFLDMQMGSSKRWVFEMAKRKFGLPEPSSYAYFAHGRESYKRMWNQINASGLDTFLILDDAAYSGKQIHTQIVEIAENYQGIKAAKVIVAVPYMSGKSLELIESVRKNPRIDLTIISPYHIFPVVKDLFRIEEMKIMYDELGFLAEDFFKPIAYFDHKIPDQLSIPKTLYDFFHRMNFQPAYQNKQSEYYRRERMDFYFGHMTENEIRDALKNPSREMKEYLQKSSFSITDENQFILKVLNNSFPDSSGLYIESVKNSFSGRFSCLSSS